MKRSGSIFALPLAAIAILQAGAAFAAPADAASDAAAADAAADAPDRDTTGLVDIVVTATKRETSLQKTPIAIAVMGEEDIKKRHVQSLLDLADGGVPSLRVATYESRQSALTIGIRGIVPGDANQPAREQGVGVYLDGVYLGRQHGLNAALFDIERIEVLKGPQGTLFGRNTEGGALNIVSKAPSGEFEGRATAGAGNYGSYNGALHLDLPAFANISVKLDGVIDHQDATTNNPLEGQLGWNYHHRIGGRVSARWEPTSNFTADISFDKSQDENTPFYSQLINFNPNGYGVFTQSELASLVNASGGIISSTTFNSFQKVAPLAPAVVVSGKRMTVADIAVPQQASVDKAMGFSAVLKWQPSDNVELRSITAWRTVDAEQWDNSGGAHRNPFLPNAPFSRYSLSFLDQDQFSQELQIVGRIGRLDYVAGLYYYNESAGEIAATPSTNKWNATGTAYTILDALTWQPANLSIARATRADSKSYAAFGQLTYGITDAIRITAGGRFTRDEKSGNLYKVNNVATNFPFVFKGDRVDPLIIAAWDAAQGVNLYAKYATGYRAGGASSRSLTFRSFGPEKAYSYEIGAKTEFLDRKVRLNVAAYIMDRKDTQFDFDFYVPSGSTFRHNLETINAGTTKIRGLETDLTVRPIEGLTANLSYAYTHVKAPSAPNPLLPGNPIQPLFVVYTPKHAASGGIDYAMPVGGGDTAVKLHIDGNYASAAYTFDNEAVKAEKSFIVNARLSLADIKMGGNGQKLTVSVWARNLLDEEHIYRRSNANSTPQDGVDYRTVIGDYANFNAPRTWGIEGTVSF
ncbi:MAG: TonB-dependent receptor [Sphingobium sp.]|nr:TonB-dependent receptor [Sphingobium sp.]MBP6111844.1 TonB-dependent receptor [Sphingobium sp.]MBP8669786.1 TonB-dependent receptor [Sphingobium sp.]MBP9156454.1 TonB-dependent receptor [Sphingobium sp.]